MSLKVSDMKKEYVIDFLQEYSFYIKEFRTDNDEPIGSNSIMCPTEFFKAHYINILVETERLEEATI